MAKKKSASRSAEQPKFEESLAALEKIVGELETGNLPLTDSIERYEKGVKLLKQCHAALDQVQSKVELLTQVGQQGLETTVPFDAEVTPADSPTRGKPESPADIDDSGRLF